MKTSLKDCLETLAHELECDPSYDFAGLASHGEPFPEKLARLRAAVDALERVSREADFSQCPGLGDAVDFVLHDLPNVVMRDTPPPANQSHE